MKAADNLKKDCIADFAQEEIKSEQTGYYPLITNMPQESFTAENAMYSHKNQYKSEHINRRAKGNYNLEPIYDKEQ